MGGGAAGGSGSVPAATAAREFLGSPRVAVRACPGAGRGVFATQPIAAGETIERAPVVVFSADERSLVTQTVLDYYYFWWGPDSEDGAIALGFGSLYNHSFEPNARYVRNLEERYLDFVALRDIAEDDEVLVNYNGDHPDALAPVEFMPSATGW
jgi:SET domain-containing protein